MVIDDLKKLHAVDQRIKAQLKEDLPKQYMLSPEASPLPLTLRQQECLSLLIRGKPVKEIAYILGIADRTVEDHIMRMKYSLGCNTKSQLIELAIDKGFLFHVPELFFRVLCSSCT